MYQINEKLIRQVFAEMVKYRPSLSRYTLDEEDEDEEVDYRILGDQVIKNYPWPFGVELRRLFSANMRELNRLRLDQMFKTIERTMQFVAFVMLSQLWHDTSKGLLTIPDKVKGEFLNRITILSLGNFSWLIRAMGNLYQNSECSWFMPEMNEVFNKKFYDLLDFWVPERNEIGHFQINLTQGEIEKRCVEYEERLMQMLLAIAFFCKYRLVSVREIQVKKYKNRDAKFQHIIDLLNSSDSDFIAKEIEETTFSESHSVLLMKSIKTIGGYLNLSPLIIDTHGEVLDSKEKFAIKKDIFMYTKFRNDQLFYLGTEVTEKCDLRSLSNYDQLLTEFQELLQMITPAEVA
jgi:hypothetical protein